MTQGHGNFIFEPLPNFPRSTGQLMLIPEESENVRYFDDGMHLSKLLAAKVPASWPPSAPEPPTNDAKTWKRFLLSHTGDDGQARIVGTAGIGLWRESDMTVQIGVALLPEFQGRGFGEELASGLGKWALSQPQYRLAVCDIPENHHASSKPLERSGYRKAEEAPAPGFVRYVLKK